MLKVIQLAGLPWWLSSKESTGNAEDVGDMGSIPGSGRSPGGGHGNPLQDSCLENPMDGGAWRATVHRVAKSGTQLKRLSTHTYSQQAVKLGFDQICLLQVYCCLHSPLTPSPGWERLLLPLIRRGPLGSAFAASPLLHLQQSFHSV